MGLDSNSPTGDTVSPILAFKNCGVARRTVAMKQTSFPSGTRQGLERALSKPLQVGLGTGGGENTG